MGHYIHTVPGRLRIKNRALKYNSRKCEIAREALEALVGVQEVKANPSTGSLTIWYDGATIKEDRLLSVLEEGRFIRTKNVNREKDPFENIVSETSAQMGQAVLSWAVGKALEASGLSLLAMLI